MIVQVACLGHMDTDTEAITTSLRREHIHTENAEFWKSSEVGMDGWGGHLPELDWSSSSKEGKQAKHWSGCGVATRCWRQRCLHRETATLPRPRLIIPAPLQSPSCCCPGLACSLHSSIWWMPDQWCSENWALLAETLAWVTGFCPVWRTQERDGAQSGAESSRESRSVPRYCLLLLSLKLGVGKFGGSTELF